MKRVSKTTCDTCGKEIQYSLLEFKTPWREILDFCCEECQEYYIKNKSNLSTKIQEEILEGLNG